MIYLLGMSHLINVMRAIGDAVAIDHDNWVEPGAPSFADLTPKPVEAFDAPVRSLVINPALGWNAQMGEEDGKPILQLSQGYLDLLAGLGGSSEADCLFSFIGGNEHSVAALLKHPSPYDFSWGTGGLLPGYQPVPLPLVQRQLSKLMGMTWHLLAAMKISCPRLRIVHVLPPPPVASEALIRRQPEVFGPLIEQYGITPLSIRMKYYGLCSELMQGRLAALGIEVLPAPAEALQQDGALRDEYAFGCTHGNEAYGTLVAAQMRALRLRGKP